MHAPAEKQNTKPILHNSAMITELIASTSSRLLGLLPLKSEDIRFHPSNHGILMARAGRYRTFGSSRALALRLCSALCLVVLLVLLASQ